jgi:uncharacterized protein YeaO (DUF488 family)
MSSVLRVSPVSIMSPIAVGVDGLLPDIVQRPSALVGACWGDGWSVGGGGRHAQLTPEAAKRLRTACIGDELYDGTYVILVTHEWPRGLRERAVDAWWPLLAPSLQTLRAPRALDGGSSWPAFALRYRAELDRLPIGTQHTTIVRLGWLLHRYPTVTLLSCEPSHGRPEAAVRSQRRVLYDWLLS